MTFTDVFIRRPVLASVVSLMLLLLGLLGINSLPIRQYPEIEESAITITTSYPGADSSLIQGFISTPIAQAVAGAEGLDYVTASSSQGISTVTAHMRLGVDANQALTEVTSKVQQVRNILPEEADDPVIVKGTGQSIALMYLGFRSDVMDPLQVTEYLTRVVQPRLATVPGVAEAQILGGQTFAMRVWIDPLRLAAFNVTADEVVTAIRASNFQAAPGRTDGPYTTYDIRTDTGLNSPEEFANLVVRQEGDTLVRLRDVANVDFGSQSTDVRVTFNGQDATFMSIAPTPSANPLTTIKAVRDLLPQLQRGMPQGMSVQILYDATEFINSSIQEVIKTLVEATLIVVIVIFLFLGSLRSVLVPIVTIPLSLVGVCFILLALGYSINLLTLLAMVLAIGLVVDDAIVVVENIHRHVEEGMRPLAAALQGAREIAVPVIGMSITLAAVYAPIGFTGGLTGTLFREFAFALAGAVIISGIGALTLSPMLASKLLKPRHGGGGLAGWIDRRFNRFARFYGRRLHGALNYRPLIYLTGLVMLIGCGFLYVNSSKELAPAEDQGFSFILLTGPQYANANYMNAFAERTRDVIQSIPETDTVFMATGFNGLNNGFAGMLSKDWSQRDRSQAQIQEDLNARMSQVAGLQAFAISPPTLPGAGGGPAFQMEITTTADPAALFEVSQQMLNAAYQSGMFIFASNSLSYDRPQLQIDIDRDKAAALGIPISAIGNTLGVLVGGNNVSRFDVQGRSYEVIPQTIPEYRLSPEELTRFYLRTGSGDLVPLSSVVSLSTQAVPSARTQFNQLNSTTIQGQPRPFTSMGDVVSYMEEQAARILPQGFSYDFTGEARQFVTEGNALAVAFGLALVVIFLVLSAQFESFRDPLIVMVCVPMSIAGALLPIFFGVATINIYTQVGLVTLIGLISKHGILMVDFANRLQRQEALNKREAIERAAAIRLRPILMTTAAMVLGVVPLLTATGAGAASRFSIGLVIASGMSIGTLFTLFVVPAFYVLMARDHAHEAAGHERAVLETAVPAQHPAE